jgi:CBS domain-containing protein
VKRWFAKDVMTADVVTVTPRTPYKEIVDLLNERAISAVPVIDEDRRVVGVVSEADLLHKLEFVGALAEPAILERKRRREAREKADGATASEIMTKTPVLSGMMDSITRLARLMDSHRIKRVPIVDEHGRLVGIVSRRDLLRVYLRNDDAIRQEIEDDVLERVLWIPADQIAVTVTNGVVTLAGTVDRRSTIVLVVRLAEGVAGAVEVVSHLTYRFDDTNNRDRRAIALS